MEIRTGVRGSGISKSFVAVCAVVATMGLGVTAGVVAKNLSAPAASTAHAPQGNFARLAPAYHQVDTRGVVQAAPAAVGPDDRLSTSQLRPGMSLSTLQVDTRGIIPAEAFAPTMLAPNSFLGPDAQDRNSQLTQAMRVVKPHGYI
jgi:hypothetical protein